MRINFNCLHIFAFTILGSIVLVDVVAIAKPINIKLVTP